MSEKEIATVRRQKRLLHKLKQRHERAKSALEEEDNHSQDKLDQLLDDLQVRHNDLQVLLAQWHQEAKNECRDLLQIEKVHHEARKAQLQEELQTLKVVKQSVQTSCASADGNAFFFYYVKYSNEVLETLGSLENAGFGKNLNRLMTRFYEPLNLTREDAFGFTENFYIQEDDDLSSSGVSDLSSTLSSGSFEHTPRVEAELASLRSELVKLQLETQSDKPEPCIPICENENENGCEDNEYEESCAELSFHSDSENDSNSNKTSSSQSIALERQLEGQPEGQPEDPNFISIVYVESTDSHPINNVTSAVFSTGGRFICSIDLRDTNNEEYKTVKTQTEDKDKLHILSTVEDCDHKVNLDEKSQRSRSGSVASYCTRGIRFTPGPQPPEVHTNTKHKLNDDILTNATVGTTDDASIIFEQCKSISRRATIATTELLHVEKTPLPDDCSKRPFHATLELHDVSITLEAAGVSHSKRDCIDSNSLQLDSRSGHVTSSFLVGKAVDFAVEEVDEVIYVMTQNNVIKYSAYGEEKARSIGMQLGLAICILPDRGVCCISLSQNGNLLMMRYDSNLCTALVRKIEQTELTRDVEQHFSNLTSPYTTDAIQCLTLATYSDGGLLICLKHNGCLFLSNGNNPSTFEKVGKMSLTSVEPAARICAVAPIRGGKIIVLWSNGVLQESDFNGSIDEITTGLQPTDFSLDHRGDVIVGDVQHYVVKLGPNYEPLFSLRRHNEFGQVVKISVSSNGMLYILDHLHFVHVIDGLFTDDVLY